MSPFHVTVLLVVPSCGPSAAFAAFTTPGHQLALFSRAFAQRSSEQFPLVTSQKVARKSFLFPLPMVALQ